MDTAKSGGWRFRGLYWRIAASYFLVTLLAALIADAALMIGPSIRDAQQMTTTESGGAGSVGRIGGIFLHNLDNLGPARFYFILLATATVTGLLVSMGITRRLRCIAQITAAWSMGNFQMRVRDPAHDEVGRLAQDLNRMAEQLQMLLATRQELAVVEERQRLARELHDSVKQHVFANALLIRSARTVFPRDPDKARVYLIEAEALAEQAQQELIDAIRALRPAALAGKGLVEVLEDYTADWSRRMGIAVELRTQGARTTPLGVEEALFRVTQEALANVARHSDAEQVDVWLVWTADNLSLTIQDNGKGFDVRRAEGKGFGLATMRERVEALHGTLAVTSTANQTSIEASVPLSLARADEPVEAVDE